MYLIVAHHFVVNSGLTETNGPIYAEPTSWRSLFLLLFGAWGKIGINCFVMITGYYMCKSNITARKFIKLFCEMMFYSIIIQLIFWLSGYEAFTVKAALRTLIPIYEISKGFTSCFLIFFLCIPFLNMLVHNLTEREHQRLLLLCGFTYILLGTAHRVTFNYVSWFIVLYFIASYIRLYPKKIFQKTGFWGWMTFGSVALSALSVISCAWIGLKLNKHLAYAFVTDSNTFLAVLTGVSSFLFFKNLKIQYSNVINTIAASTFGVLCIHASSDTMRQWLWRDILDNVGHYSSRFMPLHAIGSVLAVFVVCVVIDRVRIRILGKFCKQNSIN